jgi:hypothetical protein
MLFVVGQFVGEASMMIVFEGFARRAPSRNMTEAVAIPTLGWVIARDNLVVMGKAIEAESLHLVQVENAHH